MSARVGIAIVLVTLGAFDAVGAAQQDARGAHGGFTGEVKPVLYVTDAEASMPFFRDVLGFDFLGYSNIDGAPYYAELAAGPVKFGIHEPINAEQEERVGQQRLYFRVEDLTAHRSRVAAWGGEPGEVVETDWMDFFIVRDGRRARDRVRHHRSREARVGSLEGGGDCCEAAVRGQRESLRRGPTPGTRFTRSCPSSA